MECGGTARDVAVGDWLALGDAEFVASHAEGPAGFHPPDLLQNLHPDGRACQFTPLHL
jgi:hypothetical protein